MKHIFYVAVTLVLFSFVACAPSGQNKCPNTCQEDQEQQEDCSCITPAKAPATEIQQQGILQSILNKNEQALNQLVNKIDPDSMIDLKVLQDPKPFKALYAKNADLSGRINYQDTNLTLISLLAPLDGFDDAFKTLLSNGANPNYQSFLGLSPLRIAINADKESKTKMLLDYGAKANFEGENNIITQTYEEGKNKALKGISTYAKKAGINFVFPENYFTEAMINNQQDLAEALLPLTNKEVLNTPNNFGVLPLVQAALSNNKELFNTLIENGADINSKDFNNRTPLLQYLQEIYIAKIEGNDIVTATNEQVVPMIKLFLDKGADVKAKDNLGEDIMFYVVRGNYMELVDYLISKYNCDINTTNEQGETPLFTVAQNYPDLVRSFLEKGANPKVTDKAGRTPAVAAVEMGNMDTFDLLENAASMII